MNPSGPNHWQKASASVHAANTASRVASRTRTRTISRSRAHVVGSVMVRVLLMASPMSVGCGSVRCAPEVRIEPVETVVPRSSCVLGPCGDLDQRLRPQPAWPPLSISAATDQTRPLEDLQMTGDGRETDRERLGQLEHSCLTVGQPTHDRAPRGVRQGGEDDVEPIGGRHGHRCRRSCRYFIGWLFNRVTTYSQGRPVSCDERGAQCAGDPSSVTAYADPLGTPRHGRCPLRSPHTGREWSLDNISCQGLSWSPWTMFECSLTLPPWKWRSIRSGPRSSTR